MSYAVVLCSDHASCQTLFSSRSLVLDYPVTGVFDDIFAKNTELSIYIAFNVSYYGHTNVPEFGNITTTTRLSTFTRPWSTHRGSRVESGMPVNQGRALDTCVSAQLTTTKYRNKYNTMQQTRLRMHAKSVEVW